MTKCDECGREIPSTEPIIICPCCGKIRCTNCHNKHKGVAG